MTDYLLLALPCHAQINAEELKTTERRRVC